MSEKTLTPEECRAIATEGLAEAMKVEKWLAVCFSIKDERIVVREVSCQFPIGDHETILRDLEHILSEKRKRAQSLVPMEPLPLADFVKNHQEAFEQGKVEGSVNLAEEVQSK